MPKMPDQLTLTISTLREIRVHFGAILHSPYEQRKKRTDIPASLMEPIVITRLDIAVLIDVIQGLEECLSSLKQASGDVPRDTEQASGDTDRHL